MSSKVKKLLLGCNSCTKKNTQRIIDCISPNSKILVVGGGAIGSGMEELLVNNQGKHQILSLDVYESPNVDILADAHYIPFADNQFDLVIAQAVLEHVIEPARVVQEIRRVLKPGGCFYSEIPFMQPVHEGAFDFTRYTLSGHIWLLRGFHIVASGIHQGACTSMLMTSSFFLSAVFRSRYPGALCRVLLTRLARLIDSLIDAKWNNDLACGSYCLAVKPPVKGLNQPSAKSIVLAYRGAQ